MMAADGGFLVPTITVAMQIARQPELAALVDIIIYVIDIPDDTVRALRETFGGGPIAFEGIDSASFTPPEGTVFHKTHVPLATLARLSIASQLPEQYEHVIYLDGDIQVVGDIRPLIAHSVAEGRILAACDAMWLYENDAGQHWRKSKAYLAGLGIENPRDYFNAGVLAARRRSWVEIARDAKAFYLANSEKCHYHDQSALNAVCKGRREVLSPSFNFIATYAELGRLDRQDLRILHFTGSTKPWFYPGPPWHGRFMAEYRRVAESDPVLRPYFDASMSRNVAAIDRSYRRARRRTALATPWRTPLRRRLLRSYYRTTAFAF